MVIAIVAAELSFYVPFAPITLSNGLCLSQRKSWCKLTMNCESRVFTHERHVTVLSIRARFLEQSLPFTRPFVARPTGLVRWNNRLLSTYSISFVLAIQRRSFWEIGISLWSRMRLINYRTNSDFAMTTSSNI